MSVEVLIDLTEVDLALSQEETERWYFQMTQEIQDGLAERAYLVRQTSSPEGALAGEAGFIGSVLKAEVSLAKLPSLLGWLGEQFYGKTKRIIYKDKSGSEITLEYQTLKDLEQQQKALQSITSLLTVRVLTTKE